MLLDPFALRGMPSTDDVLILGCPTLEILGLDIYARLTERACGEIERRGNRWKV